MVAPSEPAGRLDVPLAWGRDGSGRERAVARASGPEPAAPGREVRPWELWVGYLADMGVALLCVGSSWVLAGLAGAGLNPLQIVLAAVVGLEVACFVMAASFWAFRGSPGMVLANLGFAKPVALSDALLLCLLWHLAVPLLGLPLLVQRRGLTVAERVARAPLSSRSPRGDA